MKRQAMVPAILAGLFSAALAGEVGPAIDVAPQAKDTRNQTWASAAWCEGAKCWLAVWREGYLNEQKSDIWCARISGDGKSLDPAGVKLTEGDALRDRPRVASDGKGFLVVWEEMSAGKDWDTFAATVSAEGAGGKPLLLAGGAHNQCRPDAAFAKGSYHVVWMAYDGTAYGIMGTRVSPDGKPSGGNPTTIATMPPRKPDAPVHLTLPVAATNGAGDLLVGFHTRDAFNTCNVALQPMDASTGQPAGAVVPGPAGGKNAKTSIGGRGWGGRERALALAMGPDGAVTASVAETMRSKEDVVVGRLTKTGAVQGVQELGSPLSIAGMFKPMAPRMGAACMGSAYLVASEVLSPVGGKEKPRSGFRDYYARVVAWRIKPDGSADGEAFAVAGEDGKPCMLPCVAGGPDGACLVVCSELRGVDDVKVVARVVK